MALTSLNGFLTDLREFRILPPQQLAETVGPLQQQFPNARTLAQELLRRNWLTPYQANQLLAGQGRSLLLGPYRLLQRLGEGGSGQVFKAEHIMMKRPVALKVLRADLMTDPEMRGRFEREIQVISQITHPHVVQAHDAGTVGNTYYLAMEYLQGQDLNRVVRKSGPLPVDQACDFIRQAALALQHIHEHGLVHRDVKPSNLILCEPAGAAIVAAGDRDRTLALAPAVARPAAIVKLLDLGLARLYRLDAAERTRSLTANDSMTLGTLDYLPPEQAVNFHTVDARGDIYGLGCTFYYLLTGHPPFTEGTVAEILMKHQTADPHPVQQRRPDLPPWVAALVQKMMAKRPEDRLQTAAEVAAALPAPMAIPLADSTLKNGVLPGWTARLRNFASPRRQWPRRLLRGARQTSWKVWAALAGGLLGVFLCWLAWDWWATSTYRVSAGDGSGATTFSNHPERDTVQGKAEVIRIGEQSGNSRGLVRFDLSVLRGRRNIRDAVLQLALVNPRPQARTIQVYGLRDKHDWERWDPNLQKWWGLPEHLPEKEVSALLGTIHVGRELAQTDGTVSLSGTALVDFLRADTNDVVTFGLLSPEGVREPLELASRHHSKLIPPTLRITVR